MSDEPEAIEPTAPWVMPEPVFRTTEGVTPKTAQPHLDPAPDDDMHLHDTLVNEEPSTGSNDGQAPVTAPAAAVADDGEWARGAVYIAVLLGLIVAASVAAVFYFYFDPKLWR